MRKSLNECSDVKDQVFHKRFWKCGKTSSQHICTLFHLFPVRKQTVCSNGEKLPFYLRNNHMYFFSFLFIDLPSINEATPSSRILICITRNSPIWLDLIWCWGLCLNNVFGNWIFCQCWLWVVCLTYTCEHTQRKSV